MSEHEPICRYRLALPIALLVFCIVAPRIFSADKTYPLKMRCIYVEACSCTVPCSCPMTGVVPGCQLVNVYCLTSANYLGVDLSDVKIAFAVQPRDWVRIYLDVPKTVQRSAAESLARSLCSSWGKVESVRVVQIEVRGGNGNYSVNLNDGKIAKFTTKPVLGGDGRTPITHSNTFKQFIPTLLQATVVSFQYQDDERSFTLKEGSNSYFNDMVKAHGEL